MLLGREGVRVERIEIPAGELDDRHPHGLVLAKSQEAGKRLCHETQDGASVGHGPTGAAADRRAGRSGRPWLLVFAAATTVVSLSASIAITGIWDPHELKVAELSRRIACTLLGASELALEGASNDVPALGELASGQLPYTSIAMGFAVFGLQEWAGRLPLVLWGLLGVVATAGLVARFADRTAAAFAALALSTMPLFYLHARTMLGDIVTLASAAVAVAGLAIATFDQTGSPTDRFRLVGRLLWCLVGVGGLAAGYAARGVLVGVAIPTLGVGVSWAVCLGSRHRVLDRTGNVCGGSALLLGTAALGIGLYALSAAAEEQEHLWTLVGAAVNPQPHIPTFDYVIQQLGHGLYPWSALIPVAMGILCREPFGVVGTVRERELVLRVIVLTVSGVGFGIYATLIRSVGPLPFGSVFALAAIVALALRDYDRGAPSSRTAAMLVAAIAIILIADFRSFPDRTLAAFAVAPTKFPESFKPVADALIVGSSLGLGIVIVSLIEQTPAERSPLRGDEYLAWLRALHQAYRGNLLFGMLVIEAALVGLRVVSWLSSKGLRLGQLEPIGSLARPLVHWGWAVLPVVVLAPLAGLLLRDACRALYDRTRVTRAVGAVVGMVACGATLSLGYYPALASQLSPKQVFNAYRELARPGEKLASVGVASAAANYYTGQGVATFSEARAGFRWLTQGGEERRWMVIRQKDLAELNSLYRRGTASAAGERLKILDAGRAPGAGNLPVLDARSSEILLVSNLLREGERDQNPFREWVLSERPSPARAVDANFGGQLEAIGWEVRTDRGQAVEAFVPGQSYTFCIYYEVVRPISGNWETFIHIEGHQRRFNGDHKTLGGRYPLRLWRVGDFIADIHRFRLDPNFAPGRYQVYYGLFVGSRRLEVTRGRHDHDRLRAGTISVR